MLRYDREYKTAEPSATARSIKAMSANGAPGHRSNPNPATDPINRIPSPVATSLVSLCPFGYSSTKKREEEEAHLR